MERLGYVANSWGIKQATGISPATVCTGRGLGWAYNGQQWWGDDAWEQMGEATGITRWVRSSGNRYITEWWPIAVVAKAEELGLLREGGKKITWTEGRPCEHHSYGAEENNGKCCRVATTSYTTGRDGDRVIPSCEMHAKRHAKRLADDAAREAKWAEQRERRDRAEDHKRLAEELLEWAGPLLAELGIHPKTVEAIIHGQRAGVLLPAEAVATLVELATGERYPGRSLPPTDTPV